MSQYNEVFSSRTPVVSSPSDPWSPGAGPRGEESRQAKPQGILPRRSPIPGSENLQERAVQQLFAPEVITPQQHSDQISAERSDQPEVRLMLAVMEDAVATYQRYAPEEGTRQTRLFEEARSWIYSGDKSWPYSFENICDTLLFEADSVRKGLENWRARKEREGDSRYRFPFRRVNGKRHSISLRERNPELAGSA